VIFSVRQIASARKEKQKKIAPKLSGIFGFWTCNSKLPEFLETICFFTWRKFFKKFERFVTNATHPNFQKFRKKIEALPNMNRTIEFPLFQCDSSPKIKVFFTGN
jgi:hypothetical protein